MTIKSLATFERTFCECSQCRQFCTSGKPGALSPGDLDAIADHLGVDTSEQFIQDNFVAAEDGPGTATDEFPDGATPALRPRADDSGRCIFLDGGRCSIHPAAPFECTRTRACNPADGAAAMKALGRAIAKSIDYVQTWWWLRKRKK